MENVAAEHILCHIFKQDAILSERKMKIILAWRKGYDILIADSIENQSCGGSQDN